MPVPGRFPALASLMRPFRTLRAPQSPSDVQRIERVLATARLFLVSTACLAVLVAPTTREAAPTLLTVEVLFTYLINSVLIFTLVRLRTRSSLAFRVTVHAVDILWSAGLAVFAEGPNSPFFVFFLFALVAAAYRWGYLETLGTAVAAVFFIAIQAEIALAQMERFPAIVGDVFDPNSLVMRVVYIFVFGLLLGYLAEEEQLYRAETFMVARIIAKVQVERPLANTIQLAISDILELFRASQVLLAVQELRSGRVFLWRLTPDRPVHAQSARPWEEVPVAEREDYLLKNYPATFDAVRGRLIQRHRPVDMLVANGDTGRGEHTATLLPPLFVARNSFKSLLSSSATFGSELFVRFLVFDPHVGVPRGVRLRFLQTLIRQTGPALYGAYLFRRLRTRAGAIERARVARELHDGVIQSLFGAEMQLDVLRRQALGGPTPAEAIHKVQEVVRSEILNLRDLMQHMRPIELQPRELLDFVADQVERFQRDTGISARFVSDLQEVPLSPRLCRELARIVQESLINVRKHSQASHVVVLLTLREGRWVLTVDDDGQGFSFAGRYSSAELDAARKGPIVIKERVRAMGGEIAIESAPGHGTRLEISLPQESRD